ncbi:hypothetical protein AB0K48_20650 [Nonomuraea sp. NPDC055795]
MNPDRAVVCAPTDHPMSDELIAETLRRIGEVTDILTAEQAQAVRRRAELAAERERLEHRRAGERIVVHPHLALCGIRELVAEQAEEQGERRLLEFASWWADIAAHAALAALAGTALTLGRVVATAPRGDMPADAQARLTPAPQRERRLAEMAVSMDAAQPPGATTVGGEAFAERLGLFVRRGDDGEPVLIESNWPEARRRRLWHGTWLEYETPLLPSWFTLQQALHTAGAPDHSAAAILAAAHAIDRALAFKVHSRLLDEALGELYDTDDEQAVRLEDEITALLKIGDEMPALLIDYARTLTHHLPQLRQARN